jgi:hypothetical protein
MLLLMKSLLDEIALVQKRLVWLVGDSRGEAFRETRG